MFSFVLRSCVAWNLQLQSDWLVKRKFCKSEVSLPQRGSSPKNERCCLFTHPQAIQDIDGFFSWVGQQRRFLAETVILGDSLKSMAAVILRVKKAYTGNTELIPVAPDDILRSYEEKRSVCARNWISFAKFLTKIQRLGQAVSSDVRFADGSSFWTNSF